MPTSTSTTKKKAPAKKAPAKKAAAAVTPTASEATLLHLEPGAITPHPKNPRARVANLDEMVESIRSVGVLEPVVIAPAGVDDGYVLIAGHRRLAAAKKAKAATIPALLRPDLDTDAKQLEAMLIENLHREDLTPVEEGKAYQLLLEFPGYTQTKVAKTTGRALATVRERLRLIKLPTSTQAKVSKGQITLADAQAIADFVDDPKTMKHLESQVGSYNFKYALQQAKDQRRREAARTKMLEQLQADGVRVVEPTTEGTRRVVDLPASVADIHAEHCEGHAAYVTSAEYSDARVVEVCTTPDAHPADGDVDDEDRELTQDEQRKAAEDEVLARTEAELLSAAKVRWAHLAGVVQHPDEIAVLHAKRAEVAKDVERSDAYGRALLGLGEDANMDAIDLQLARLALANLLVLEGLLDRRWTDRELLKPDGWGRRYEHASSDYTKDWRDELVEVLGYQWSEAEQAAIDAAAAKWAKPTEPADVDEDLDDDAGAGEL